MTQVANQPAAQQQTPAVVEASIAETVMHKIKIFTEAGSINIPKNYSAANALRIAWLILQETKTKDNRPVLDVCTKASIANSLFKMIILGLNPAKKQCSFISYGAELSCQKEYQGTVTIAKRHGVIDVTGCAVFKDDKFNFVIDPKTGYKTVTEHEQSIESIDTGLVKAAYATKFYEGGKSVTEVMSISQIKKAWAKGAAKGQSPAHIDFPDEMAIKTVKNRLLKPDVNSSDDADLFDDEDDNENAPTKDVVSANVQHRIAENANKSEMGFDEPSLKNGQQEKPSAQAQPEPSENGGPGF